MRLQSHQARKKIAQCLDGKRTQAIEIFLNGAGVTFDQVRNCIQDLNPKALGLEQLCKVVEFYPPDEELGTLKAFQEANDPKVLPWGRAEEFLISMINIAHFKTRGECCVVRAQFGEDFDGIAQDVGVLKTCLNSVASSTALPAVFRLVMQMGNYLNYGTAKGAQCGFSLDTLPLLIRVEGFNDKTYSLMRFLMDTLEGDRTVREEAFEDLKLCDSVAKLDFEESVRRLSELEKNVAKVEVAIKSGDPSNESGPSKINDEKFDAEMRKFVSDAKSQLTTLRTQADAVTELSKKVTDFYAEKPKTPTGEYLAKFADFRKNMVEARQQNLVAKAKQDKARKARAEKENAAPKEANAPSVSVKNPSSSPACASSPSKEMAMTKKPSMGKEKVAMKVTIPETPMFKTLSSKMANGASAPSKDRRASISKMKETSGGVILGGSNLEVPGRMSVGATGRREMFSVPDSGRISLGISHASHASLDKDKTLDKALEDYKRLFGKTKA